MVEYYKAIFLFDSFCQC